MDLGEVVNTILSLVGRNPDSIGEAIPFSWHGSVIGNRREVSVFFYQAIKDEFFQDIDFPVRTICLC